MIITLPAKYERRARPVFGQEAEAPTAKEPYRTPGDPPCKLGPPLYEGGPLVPCWVWRELRADVFAPATAAQLAYLKRLGIADEPKDKDQASAWIDEAVKWRALVP